MLINEAYFINTINHIPNLTGCVKNERFTEFMKMKSEEALCLVLGVCLVNEIKEHLGDNLLLEDDAPQHIKDLVNGVIYENTSNCNCSNTCSCSSVGTCNKLKWKGLINTDYRNSLIADYVYFQWMLRPSLVCCDNDKAMEHEILKQHKRIDAWNRFVSDVQECGNCEVSLYRFLKDHKENYPEQQGTCFSYKNYMNV